MSFSLCLKWLLGSYILAFSTKVGPSHNFVNGNLSTWTLSINVRIITDLIGIYLTISCNLALCVSIWSAPFSSCWLRLVFTNFLPNFPFRELYLPFHRIQHRCYFTIFPSRAYHFYKHTHFGIITITTDRLISELLNGYNGFTLLKWAI